jgi:hypothetical protein
MQEALEYAYSADCIHLQESKEHKQALSSAHLTPLDATEVRRQAGNVYIEWTSLLWKVSRSRRAGKSAGSVKPPTVSMAALKAAIFSHRRLPPPFFCSYIRVHMNVVRAINSSYMYSYNEGEVSEYLLVLCCDQASCSRVCVRFPCARRCYPLGFWR